MILRKPYALLIKHFRLIHIALSVLLVYLAIKTTGIVSFFSDYARSGTYTYVNNLAGSYINFFMYGAILLVLALTITIYLLMKSKDKKRVFYVATIIYYIILFVLLTVAFSILQTLQSQMIDTQTIRAYRDFSFILYLPQFFFIFFSVFRAIGFDIKKFNFANDMAELEIEEKDNEEVEIIFGKNSYKARRLIRRFLREMLYYIKENTFIFASMVAITIIIIGSIVFFNRSVYNQTIRNSNSFSYQAFKMKTISSMLTNVDYNGNIIRDSKYYLVINFNTINQNYQSILDKKDFRLMVNNDIIYPLFGRNEYFIDYGNPYKGEKIKNGTNKDYLLIFEMDEKQVQKEYRLQIVDKINYKVGEIHPSYKDVIIKPEKINTITTKKEYALNETISFKDSLIGDSSLTISKFQIIDNYRYTYDFCHAGTCTESTASITSESTTNQGNTLLILDTKLNLADSPFKSNIKLDNRFYSAFVKVRYETEADGVKTTSFVDRTPSTWSDKVVLQLSNKIKNAHKIDLIITIRNIEYTVNIYE